MAVDDQKGPHYEVVMPFLVCKSLGGPYDDAAFVAGARFGSDKAALEAWKGTQPFKVYAYPEMVQQYDLLAMRLGLTMESEPWGEAPDEWVLLTFRRPGRRLRPDRGGEQADG